PTSSVPSMVSPPAGAIGRSMIAEGSWGASTGASTAASVTSIRKTALAAATGSCRSLADRCPPRRRSSAPCPSVAGAAPASEPSMPTPAPATSVEPDAGVGHPVAEIGEEIAGEDEHGHEHEGGH